MQKKILIAPLDWGLGHATRCIPIIRQLFMRQQHVVLAGNGASLELLRKEFPSLESFDLPGYDPAYPSTGSMVWKMAGQLPRFMRVIREEHALLEKIIAREHIDGVIADNRYGCWSSQVPSVFITHQSNILMPQRFGWLRPVVQWANHQQISKFSTCWIPAHPQHDLGTSLMAFGKPDQKIPVEYIGTLSRFTRTSQPVQQYDVAAIFSGPEPQRTMVENIVVPQLQRSGMSYVVVRGLLSSRTPVHPHMIDFMTGDALRDLMESSAIIIARSGYSTIMDLQALQKKAILIPTPGQTEQEHLSAELLKRNIVFSMPQAVFNLSIALQESKKYSGFTGFTSNTMLLEQAIDNLLSRIPQRR